MSGYGKAVEGFKVENNFGPRTVSGGPRGRPLKPGVEIEYGPEELGSWSEESGLSVKIGEGEVRMGKTERGGDMGTSWGVPGITKSRGERGGGRAGSPSSSCESASLLSLLQERTPGKEDLNHYSLDGAGLRRSGLVSLPGEGRRVKQTEPEGSSLIGPIIALFINGEDEAFSNHDRGGVTFDFTETEGVGLSP
jgi:hypothetical protein